MKYLRGENSRSFGVKIDKDSITNEAVGQIIIISWMVYTILRIR